MKFGVWIAIAVIAFLWFNHAKKQRLRERHARQHDQAGADAPPLQGEPIVACAHCGLHVPTSDAVLGRQGIAYCSEAHRLLQPPA